MSIASEITRLSGNISNSLDAVAAKGVTVPSGSTSDDLPQLIAAIPTGSGAAISIVDTTDANGGTIRTITGVSLAGDTVTAAHLETGYTAHDALGNPITGQLSPGGTPNLQAKTNISPTESSQTIEADSGYDGLSSVQINAVSSSYVGSGITRRSSTDLSASGATVTVPAGYYASQATKSVSSGSATGPTSLSGSSATVSTGTNTITLTKTGVTTTPTVSAGYVASATASTATVALTASVTTKAATTYHPSTSDQTIASGSYTTGTQTIKAVTVSGLAANKILSGTTVKIGDSTDDDCVTSVAGSVTFSTIYSGSSNPSSSTGVNGDIYIQTS